MKKLGKLKLQKEKMLSHEELVNFRGGLEVDMVSVVLKAAGFYIAQK